MQPPSAIHEVIIATQNSAGEAHFAPMGIHCTSEWVWIQPFQPSSTYTHLTLHRECVVNFTDDVRVFAGALTQHRNWPSAASTIIQAPYLADALSHWEIEIVDVEDTQPRASFRGRIVHQATHRPFLGFNRAQAAVIEASILLSRVHLLPVDKIRQEWRYLQIAVQKTAGPREQQAWQWLAQAFSANGLELEDG